MNLDELIASIEPSPIAFLITSAKGDLPILAANDAFCALTGYERDELLGRNCRLLQGPDTDQSTRAAIREALAAGRTAIAEILNYRRDGSPFRNGLVIAPVLDDEGELAFFYGSQVALDRDLVMRRHQASRAVQRLSRRQKEVLKEIVRGQGSKQIAKALTLSERTVEMHRARLITNLNVRTTAEAIRIAVEADL